jgi:bleomycin hydrolase
MRRIVFAFALTIGVLTIQAQESVSQFKFEPVTDLPVTPVKSQDRTGTCWSFSTTSFIESEILRMGGSVVDLSEMFFVRHTYPMKARRHVMRHGHTNFHEGGQAHDVMNVMKVHGMVPEKDFPGRRDVSQPHDHSELIGTQRAVLKNFLEMKKTVPNKSWHGVLDAILTVYLGDLPGQVDYKGEQMSPQDFQKKMKVNPDDYVELTSYSHQPWYVPFVLEVPDNWSDDTYYNLPLDEFMEVMNHALESGYTFVWDGDVSEKHFSHQSGAAIVPEDEEVKMGPVAELSIDQAYRQAAFMSWKSTDDHLMHITGLSKDQNGTRYYKTKNSWGTARNDFGGYLYMSESYMRLHTVAIMVHRDAIPKAIAKKMFK